MVHNMTFVMGSFILVLFFFNNRDLLTNYPDSCPISSCRVAEVPVDECRIS